MPQRDFDLDEIARLIDLREEVTVQDKGGEVVERAKYWKLPSHAKGFLAEHARHEKLPRTPCPECQFEANAEQAPHAPGCSEGCGDA